MLSELHSSEASLLACRWPISYRLFTWSLLCGLVSLTSPPLFLSHTRLVSEWKSLSHVRLFASLWTVHGILQARVLEWVAFPFSRRSSQPRDRTQVSRIAGGFFNELSHKRSPRILEWVAYSLSRGFSQPWNWTGVSCIAGRFLTNWAIREALILD